MASNPWREGFEAIVIRTVSDQVSLWEAVLPPELLKLPDELARVDALLDDPVFFTPFVPFFDPRMGRPSTPMETYLRLMFLKFRYRLGYESLCREVSDSITWRRFCRIPLDGAVPHPTTLMKLSTRCGSAAVQGLNEALLAKAIRRIGAAGARIHNAGGAVRTRLRDRSRAAGKRAHGIAAKLRSRSQLGRDHVKDGVQRVTGELADLAQAATRDARRLLGNARRSLRRAQAKAAQLAQAGVRDAAGGRRRGRLARAINHLSTLLEATAKITEQARQRIAGRTPDGATRVVSLHDRDARPIAKGRLGKPVEFGYKGQVVDNDDGIVVDHQLHVGNPADAPQLVPAIQRVTARSGRPPATVTADRGYGEAAVEHDLSDLGVRTVVIPRKGRPGAARQQVEKRPAFRRTIKWRTGCEGRISTLKRGYGWDRTRLDSLEGAKTWTGQGIFTHNLIKIAALTT
jgi:transposase, IS5 family